MKKLAIISQKGGAGKTMLAINLAVAAVKARQATVLIDLDPQASAADISDSRKHEKPAIVSAQASRLGPVLTTAAEHGAKFIVMDTAPHSESAALEAARAADFMLIPCRPSILDLRAIKGSIDIARLAKVSFAVVLNCVQPKGRLEAEASEAIASYGAPVCPVTIGSRIAFVHGLTSGLAAAEYESQGKAAGEIEKLYRWLRRKL